MLWLSTNSPLCTPMGTGSGSLWYTSDFSSRCNTTSTTYNTTNLAFSYTYISLSLFPTHFHFSQQSGICNKIKVQHLLFSAHISYGKGKYLNQTGFFFFLQNLPRFYLYLNLRVLPIEFNPHKFSFVRYVFVEIFEVFLKNDENDENDPLMTK